MGNTLTDISEDAVSKAAARRTPFRWNLPTVLSIVTIVALPAFAFILSIHQLKGGWDDGAITAAFSRTLAETGRFALTPLSEKVEGFSSVTWVLLLTVPHYLFHTANSILVWMKLLSAISFLLSLVVFRKLAHRLLTDDVQTALTVALLAFNLGPLAETLNGMEMNLCMLIVLCLVALLSDEQLERRRVFLIWILTFALVATRFESPYAVVALLAGLLLARKRSSFLQLAVALAVSFGAMELWRYWEFGLWMPNTVYAKMQPPYSPPHELTAMLQTRVSALAEIIPSMGTALFPLLLAATVAALWTFLPLPRPGLRLRLPLGIFSVAAALWITAKSVQSFYIAPAYKISVPVLGLGIVLLAIGLILKACLRRRASREAMLTSSLIVAGVAFGVLFGKNWGYPGRMILPYIPFLLLGIAYFLHQHVSSQFWRRVALGSCVACQLLIWIPGALHVWTNGYQVPISLFENTGRDADAVRQLLHRPALTLLLPDMGGSSLCCEKLQVFDSALLTNPYLARHGYAAFGEYLNRLRPEVIETHGIWSVKSGIYNEPIIENYELAVVGRSRLLLRDDIYRQLEATDGAQMVYGKDCAKGIIDPAVRRLDDRFLIGRQQCLFLSREDLLRNGVSLN